MNHYQKLITLKTIASGSLGGATVNKSQSKRKFKTLLFNIYVGSLT